MTKHKTYNYRISLKPLDFFFFGGENTFGNGEGQNYFAKTRPYPQQTAILGVLRYLGLKEATQELPIGESFVADDKHYASEAKGKEGKRSEAFFGYIHQLSALFMRKDGGDNAGNYAFGPSFLPVLRASPLKAATGKVKQFCGGQWIDSWELPALDPKEWPDSILLGESASVIDRSEVIKTSTRIGITKNKDGEERKDGFYKQEVGHLAPGWSFAVLAHLDDELAQKIEPATIVVPFGAEKALFAVSLHRLTDEEKRAPLFPPANFAPVRSLLLRSVALVSDAYVDKTAFEALPFAIASTVDFRNIYTPKGITNFGRFTRNSHTPAMDRMTQSGKYTLLSRGSILYANTEQELTNLLEDERFAHWQKIGYNQFVLLKNTQA